MARPARDVRASIQSSPCEVCDLEPLCFPDAMDVRPGPTASIRQRELAEGQHLIHAGQACRSLLVLCSGSARSYSLSVDGTEWTSELHLPGEPIGLEALGSERHAQYLVALQPSTYCELRLAQLRPLMDESGNVRRAVTRLMGAALGAWRNRCVSQGRGAARNRVAAFLNDQGERRRRRGMDGDDFRLSLDRGNIANLLGLTVETVSRALAQLQRDGLIRVSGKHVVIRDRAALQLEANGEAR